MSIVPIRLRSRLSRRSARIRGGWLVLLLFSSLACATEADDPAWRSFRHALGEPALIGANADHSRADTPYRPIPSPEPEEIDPLRYQLGFRLFHEGRLSSGNSIGCISCHTGVLSGADQRQVSAGVDGALGTANALSVFNATFNFRQFWDGRSVTLEDQALEPIQNPVEMANTLEDVEAMLETDEQYRAVFESAYPDGVTARNMADALAHFQRINFRRLESPFQRYLRGDEAALGSEARRGWQQFEELGCIACHNGINLGGNSYQALGALLPYYNGDSRVADEHDTGVMARSGRKQDRYVWRVPGLHGVASTAPYFHDGTVDTLEDAIGIMLENQHGLKAEPDLVADIAAFLRSLSVSFTPYREVGTTQESSTMNSARVDHEARYSAVITSLGQTIQALPMAMQAVHDQEVAHFDFLQFQHRELIRYARALHHPPSSLPMGTRKTLADHATTLLADINDMEWVIADFLRARAMIDVLETLKSTPKEMHHADAPSPREIEKRLADQRAIAVAALADIQNHDLAGLLAPIKQIYELSSQGR